MRLLVTGLWAYVVVGFLAALSFGFAVMPRDMTQAILGSRIYFGSAPVFAFSIVIYMVETLALLYVLRRLGILQALGSAALLTVASYYGYELAFKSSFLLFGPDRVKYFMSYEVYPSAVFIFGLASILAIRNRINARSFALTLAVFAPLWVAWIISGSFPLDVQAYEANPEGATLLFNFLTKLVFSSAFVAAAATSTMKTTRSSKRQRARKSKRAAAQA